MADEPMVQVPGKRLADWLADPIRANWRTYSKVALAATLINLFGLVTALFTMTVYDRVVPNAAFSSLAATRCPVTGRAENRQQQQLYYYSSRSAAEQ